MTGTIGIFLFDGAEELDFVGPYEGFTMAIEVFARSNKPGPHDVRKPCHGGRRFRRQRHGAVARRSVARRRSGAFGAAGNGICTRATLWRRRVTAAFILPHDVCFDPARRKGGCH
jgi:hypothetical protein